MVSHVWSPPKTRYRGADLSIKKSAFDSLVAISLLITLPQAAEAEELDNRLVHQAIRCGTGFIPNRGQWSKDVSFGCATKSGVFFVANGSIFAGINVYNTSSQIAGRDWIQFEFVGANGSAEASGRHSRKSTTSFFRGKDPSKWVSSLPSFDDVYVADYYPGIDLALRVKRTGIEYDFLLDANVDPSTIRMRIVGATAITESTNRLEISTPFGSLVQKAPRAFQMNADGSWAETPCRVVKWEHGIYGFLLPERDPRLPVCIDPDVAAPDWYFSYLGGNDGFLPSAPQTPNQGEDQILDVAVSGGVLYVTGCTSSIDFPIVSPQGVFPPPPPQYDSSATLRQGIHTSQDLDVFVAAVSVFGELLWSTYVGGPSDDNGHPSAPNINIGRGIAIGGAPGVYVVGYTNSNAGFPTTSGAFQGSGFVPGSGIGATTGDAFALKLSSSGSNLLYSTYLGGNFPDVAEDVAVDSLGNAYVAGWTDSCTCGGPPNYQAFPTTPQAANTQSNGPLFFGFVTKLNPSASSIVYSTYLSTTDSQGFLYPELKPYAIALMESPVSPERTRAFVTGSVSGHNMHVTTNAFQVSPGGGSDAFLIGLDETGSTYTYATYFGGAEPDRGLGIAVSPRGAVVVVGDSSSTSTFPTKLPLQPGYGGGQSDGFVAVFDPSQTMPANTLEFCTFVGGIGTDSVVDVSTDAASRIYICGSQPGSLAYFNSNSGVPGGYLYAAGSSPKATFVRVIRASPSGAQTVSESRFGAAIAATNQNEPFGIAVDSGAVYVAGRTYDMDVSTFAGMSSFAGVQDQIYKLATGFGTAVPSFNRSHSNPIVYDPNNAGVNLTQFPPGHINNPTNPGQMTFYPTQPFDPFPSQFGTDGFVMRIPRP